MNDSPIPIGTLEREGLEAYSLFFDALTNDDIMGLAPRETVEFVERVLPALPRPTANIPLRILVSLASAVRTGELEQLYHTPRATASDVPASQELREWLVTNDQTLSELFPELRTGFHRRVPWRNWRSPSGSPLDSDRLTWDDLTNRAREIAGGLGQPAAQFNYLFFSLVRDWSGDIEPLLDNLGLQLGTLLARARALLPSETSYLTHLDPTEVTELDDGYSDLINVEKEIKSDLELPTSAWTVFAAFTVLRPLELGPLAAELPSEELVLDAVRHSHQLISLRHRPERTIARDYWVEDDAIGNQVYADAIVEFIRHERTEPPLTIGIKAPWGAGKTSLMRMVRKSLDPNMSMPLPGLGGTVPKLSVNDLLTAVRTPVSDRDSAVGHVCEPRPASEREVGDPKHRPTVWFNAWKYQSAEQVWAGLGHEIILQLTHRMSTAVRERFWARLNLSRVSEVLVRRAIYRALFDRIASSWSVVVAAMLAVTTAVLSLALPPSVSGLKTGSASLFIGSVLALATTVYSRVRGFLATDASAAYSDVVQEPGYEGKLGFLHLVHSDMDRVLDLVATPSRPVVIFVDDLDRCSWDVVAKVIEAINLFLSGDFPNCIFVIAIEPDAVAAHIEVAYESLTKALGGGYGMADEPPLGWRFLEKMVQLPLSLPTPGAKEIDAYIASIFGADEPEEEIEPEDLHDLEELALAEPSLDDVVDAAIHLRSQQTGSEKERLSRREAQAVLRVVGERFTDDDIEVRRLIRRHAGRLSRNPREIKRFINVFRFLSFIQIARRANGMDAPTFDQVGKLSALAVRWPNLLTSLGRRLGIDGEDTVLERLEQIVGGEKGVEEWTVAIVNMELSERLQRQLSSHEFRKFLATEPGLGRSAAGFL